MASVFVVLHLVLSLLGMHQAIELLDRLGGTPAAKAAVTRPDDIVAAVTQTPPTCRAVPHVQEFASDADSLIEFAATVVHEWSHLRNGAPLATTCRGPIAERDGH